MKQVIMERKFFNGMVRQESDTGFLCVSDFIKIANKWRTENGITNKEKSPRNIKDFWKLESSKEFLTELSLYENVLQQDLKRTRRGQYTGVWCHPSLFLKIALWTSPKLEVRVYEWVMDELLGTRDQGGESFKKVMSELRRKYSEVKNNPIWHKRISRTVYRLCGLPENTPDRWNKKDVTIDQHKKREQIHEQLIMLKDLHDSIEDLLIYVWNYNKNNGSIPTLSNKM